MPDSNVSRLVPRSARPGVSAVIPALDGADDPRSVIGSRPEGVPEGAQLIERSGGKGRDVAIIRKEPRDLAPVVELPVRMHGNRVIEPVDAAPGTRLTATGDPAALTGGFGYDPGPLARALMAMQAADGR